MRLSVIICTRNRARSLEQALAAWGTLAADPDWDIVVVDDGSTDDTPELIQQGTLALRGRLTTFRTPGVGLGAARNIGWRPAGGAAMVFSDDDCWPAPDLLAGVRRRLATLDFVGGRLLPGTVADGAVAVVTRTDPEDFVGPMFVRAGAIPGANLAVRRSALLGVGGFDDELGAGTPFPAEDVDLIARLVWAGYRGAYDPSLVVYHHHGRSTADQQRALGRSYDGGRGAYYAKCLTNPAMRPEYLRGWLRATWNGSWPRAGRELLGAVRYWTRAGKETS